MRWQHAAGPFWPYVGLTPFISGTHPPSTPFVHRPAPRAIRDMLGSGNRAVILDLPAGRSLSWARALNRLGFCVVPVVHRWNVEPAALPVRRIMAGLLAGAVAVRRPARFSGAIFLLDGGRAGLPGYRLPPSTPRFDNRYRYPLHVFPPPALLLSCGLEEVTCVREAGPAASDLLPYREALALGGVAVHDGYLG